MAGAVFVKICGITRPADAIAAVCAGVDAIGLNFVPTSSRCIDIEIARAILAVVPDHTMTVGVFRNHPASEVLEITGTLGLTAAQLHGDEPPEVTAGVAAGVKTVIKVVVAGSPAVRCIDEHAADIIMFDAPIPGGGVPFDRGLVGDLVTNHRILLAGGLRPDNVAAEVRQASHWLNRSSVSQGVGMMVVQLTRCVGARSSSYPVGVKSPAVPSGCIREPSVPERPHHFGVLRDVAPTGVWGGKERVRVHHCRSSGGFATRRVRG